MTLQSKFTEFLSTIGRNGTDFRYLKIVRHLKRALSSLQLGAVLGREVADLAQALALPPVGVRRVDHGHLLK